MAAQVAAPARGQRVAVEAAHVHRGGQPVLTGVDLDVPAGRTLALLGPSGCGKTTLLRAIAGLEPLQSGRVVVGDRVLDDGTAGIPAERRHVGMVFQDWALFPHMTVGRNVGFGLSRRDRQGDTVARTLALVDLAGMQDRMPSSLSGGQQQRVAIARALATRPAALLLDEPFSNLDASLRDQVRGEVASLLRDLGITTVLVTHDQEEAFLLGDEVAVMLDGVILQQDTPGALYRAPASAAVAAFLGHANLVPADASGDDATTPVGRVPLAAPASGATVALLRPEHLQVTAASDGGDVVDQIEFYGHDAIVRVRRPDGTTLDVRTLSTPRVAVGDTVHLQYVGPPTVTYPA